MANTNSEMQFRDYGNNVASGRGDNPGANGNENGLSRLDTGGSVVTISMGDLEKLYLNPPQRVQGHLRETFGNPTPL